MARGRHVDTEDTFDSMDMDTPGVHDDITDSGMISGDTSLDAWPAPETVAFAPVIEATVAEVVVEPAAVDVGVVEKIDVEPIVVEPIVIGPAPSATAERTTPRLVAARPTTSRPAQAASPKPVVKTPVIKAAAPKPVVKAPRSTRTSRDGGAASEGLDGRTGITGDVIVKTAIPLDPSVAEQLRLVAFLRSGNYEISSVIRPAIDEVLAELTSGPAGDREGLAETIRRAPKHSRNSLFSVRITAAQAHALRLAAIHAHTSVAAIIRAAIDRVIEDGSEGMP